MRKRKYRQVNKGMILWHSKYGSIIFMVIGIVPHKQQALKVIL